MKTNTNDATILLRLPSELKTALLRAAAVSGRRITSEVNIRLRQSIDEYPQSVPQNTTGQGYIQTNLGSVHVVNDSSRDDHSTKNKWPASDMTELDRAMLEVFRRMPPEKQLALLSLFK